MKKKNIISLFAVAGAALALASCGNDKQISVTYYDGESKVTQKVDKNTLLETPTKDGYVFAGWYTDSDYKKKYEEVMLTDSISLYAKWTLAEVTPSEEKKNDTPETPQNNENNQTTSETPQNAENNQTTPETPQNNENNQTTPETPQNTENNQTTPETPQNNENNQTTPETPQNTENNQTTPETPQNTENNQTTPETPQNNENTTPETPNNETQEESLADYKDGLQTQLQAFAQERIDAYSALSTSITTLRDNGNTAIDGALDKVSADAALTAAKNAIISAVNEYNKANSTINVTKALGATESLYLEWDIVTGADSYNVYYKTASSNYQRINDMLIRQYTDHMRADIVGLATGSYTVKIVPVFGEEEGSNSIEQTISVTSTYDRSGFAWVNGTSSGAYNDNGTLKDKTVVLYVTESNKDSIKLNVVTSNKGATTECTGIVSILESYKKGYDSRPLNIRIVGKVTNTGALKSNSDCKGDMVISGSGKEASKRLKCGITVEGIGEDATAYGWGIRVKNCTNVEIRNIGFMSCNSDEGDDIGLQQDNDHVWVHNCDMFYGDAGSDSDQAKGDGALDCKLSTYVTFSYNHFWDTGKSNLLGLKGESTEGYYITYHHNWYDHSDSRHPRVRFYSAHVYNNYYDGCSKYGIGATLGSSVFAESNYFRNVQYPILTSMQGSDVFAGGTARDVANNATFSKEAGGTIKAYGNIMTDKYTFIPYGCENYTLKGNSTAYNLTGTTSTADFDAVVVTDRNATIENTIVSYTGSNTYNNFDTASTMYTYTADAAEDVPTVVTAKAGRLNGGDFQWTFNNAVDDESYAVNTELKAALKAYKGGVVAIQGDAKKNSGVTVSENNSSSENNNSTSQGNSSSDNNNTNSESNNTQEQNNNSNTPQVTGAVAHNFTTDGLTSTVFTFTSYNLSTSKGTASYNNLTLTQCLKIEKDTTITFTTTEAMTLTLVFNSDFAKGIKVDGEKKSATAGIVTVNLAAGSHTITKGDSANLYYIALA